VSQSSLESFKCSLANFRRPCTCASLSRGTLRVLQYFKPLRRNVLPMVFLVTVVPAALRSFTSSPCVVLGSFCTFRMITDTVRGDILHGAPDPERLTVVWYCFHLRIIAPIVVCFSPSCLPMVLQPISALCRSTILSLTSLVNSLGLPMVVRLKVCSMILWTGFFYTRHQLRSG